LRKNACGDGCRRNFSDTPARLRQHEKRELFPAFAWQEPVLPNKLLGLKFSEDPWPNLSLSFPYP
jgi:hypothetical protein